jgi:hypothetical protein
MLRKPFRFLYRRAGRRKAGAARPYLPSLEPLGERIVPAFKWKLDGTVLTFTTTNDKADRVAVWVVGGTWHYSKPLAAVANAFGGVCGTALPSRPAPRTARESRPTKGHPTTSGCLERI